MDYSVITTSDPRQAVMKRFWGHWAKVEPDSELMPRELIIVDDHGLWVELSDKQLQERCPSVPLRILRPTQRLGQARALRRGAEAASCELLLFIDPDMVDVAESTPALLAPFAAGAAAVHGQRCSGASSNSIRRAGSWLFNVSVRAISGLAIPDINSPVFVHRRQNLSLLSQAPAGLTNPQFALYAQLANNVVIVPINSQSAVSQPSSYSAWALVMLFFRQLFDAWRVRSLKRATRTHPSR